MEGEQKPKLNVNLNLPCCLYHLIFLPSNLLEDTLKEHQATIMVELQQEDLQKDSIGGSRSEKSIYTGVIGNSHLKGPFLITIKKQHDILMFVLYRSSLVTSFETLLRDHFCILQQLSVIYK